MSGRAADDRLAETCVALAREFARRPEETLQVIHSFEDVYIHDRARDVARECAIEMTRAVLEVARAHAVSLGTAIVIMGGPGRIPVGGVISGPRNRSAQ